MIQLLTTLCLVASVSAAAQHKHPHDNKVLTRDVAASATGYVFSKGENTFGSLGSSYKPFRSYAFDGSSDLNLIDSSAFSEKPRFNFPTRYGLGSSASGIGLYGNLDLGDKYGHSSLSPGNTRYGFLKKGLNIDTGTSNLGSPGELDGLGVDGVKGIHHYISETSGGSDYKKGGGSKFKAAHKAASGEKGAEGYKVAEDFDKGEKAAVKKGHQAGKYDTATAIKKGDEEEAKRYEESQAAAKGQKGESYGKSEGHKKGHKTTGFHNVYHKDEYKKDTSFYDDEHESKHEEAYGEENSRHSEDKAQQRNIAKVDAAFHEDQRAKEGAFTNGHQYGGYEGHDRREGEAERYDNGEHFAKESEVEAGKEKGTVHYSKKVY